MTRIAILIGALGAALAIDGDIAKKLAKPVAIVAPAVKRGFAATKLLAIDEAPGFNEVVQLCKWTQPPPPGGKAC